MHGNLPAHVVMNALQEHQVRRPAPRPKCEPERCVRCHDVLTAERELTPAGFACGPCAREYPTDVDGSG